MTSVLIYLHGGSKGGRSSRGPNNQVPRGSASPREFAQPGLYQSTSLMPSPSKSPE